MSACEAGDEDRRGAARSHTDPRWYTPCRLPPAFQALDTPVAHLGVGSAGKVGLLDLALAPVCDATRIVRQFQQMPLYLFHPIYVDTGRPDMAFLYLLQGGDGLLQGDRYRLDVACAPGAAAHITTQAATKLYRMENNYASQLVHLTAGAGAYVEYLPDPVIPFRDARFYQRMRLTVDASATVIIGETLLPGRVAYQEAHDYTLYCSDMEVYSPDGMLLFADRIALGPAAAAPRSTGLLGPYSVLATLYIVTRQLPPHELVEALRAAVDPQHAAQQVSPDAVLAGVSELPNGSGVVVRILGATSLDVRHALQCAWNAARLLLIGVPAPDRRKG